MTRREFIEEVNDFDDLTRFCWNNDCSICEYIRDGEQFDDYIWESIRDWDYSWENLRDWLDGLPSVDRWDYVDTEDECRVLDDDDFEDYKRQVEEWMTENDYWDNDDEEEIEDENGNPPRPRENPSCVNYLFDGPAPEPENPMANGIQSMLFAF